MYLIKDSFKERVEVEANIWDLTADERFRLILNSDDSAQFFKESCIHVEPGTLFNVEGIGHNPKVLLVGAYEPTDLPAGRFNSPSYGLQRLASFLYAAGISVDIFPMSKETDIEALLQKIKTGYDLVGVSSLGPTVPYDIQIINSIKTNFPEIPVVVGGHAPTASPELYLQSDTNFLIKGYGEDALLNLIVGIRRGSETDGIAGLYINEKNAFVGDPASVPTYEDLKIYSYLLDPTIGTNEESINPTGLYGAIDARRVSTYRFIAQGYCPRECSFCSTRNFLRTASEKDRIPYIALRADDRVKVLENLLNKLQDIKTLFINDDDFFTNRRMARLFFQEIIERKNNGSIPNDLAFIMSARIDELDSETLRIAGEAGVLLINIGVESFSPKILHDLSKGIRSGNEDIRSFIMRNLEMIISEGIIPSINLILFPPQTSWEDIELTCLGALDVMKLGGEVNLTTYIRNYLGADILDNDDIPYYSHLELLGKDRSMYKKTVLLPKDAGIQKLARKAIIQRSIIEENYKRDWGWRHRRAPTIVVQYSFIRGIFEAAKTEGFIEQSTLDTVCKKIDEAVSQIFIASGAERTDEEKHNRFASIDPEHLQEAIELSSFLLSIGWKNEDIETLLALKVDLFCEIWHQDAFISARNYMQYLFFAEEKSRFFHLNSTQKAIALLLCIDSIGRTESISEVLRYFVIDKTKVLGDLKQLQNQIIWKNVETEVGFLIEFSRVIELLTIS